MRQFDRSIEPQKENLVFLNLHAVFQHHFDLPDGLHDNVLVWNGRDNLHLNVLHSNVKGVVHGLHDHVALEHACTVGGEWNHYAFVHVVFLSYVQHSVSVEEGRGLLYHVLGWFLFEHFGSGRSLYIVSFLVHLAVAFYEVSLGTFELGVLNGEWDFDGDGFVLLALSWALYEGECYFIVEDLLAAVFIVHSVENVSILVSVVKVIEFIRS